jgi:predicted HAD superfamily Cof-like phosphohydrolase
MDEEAERATKLEAGVTLLTKDSERMGNGIVVNSTYNEGLQTNIYLVETDYGNQCSLTFIEVDELFSLGYKRDYASWRKDRQGADLRRNLALTEPDVFSSIAEKLGISRTDAKEAVMRLLYDEGGRKGIFRPTPYEQVAQFHEKFGLPHGLKPHELTPEEFSFRYGFMAEELAEYALHCGYDQLHTDMMVVAKECRAANYEKTGDYHPAEAFDGLLDLEYVVNGTALFHGFPMDEGLRRVQAANMGQSKGQRHNARGVHSQVQV